MKDLTHNEVIDILKKLRARHVAGPYWQLGRGGSIDSTSVSNVTHLCALCFQAGIQDKQTEIREALGVKEPR